MPSRPIPHHAVSATLFLSLCGVMLISARSLRAADIPIEDFFRHPEEVDYKLSPDGEHLAYVGLYEGHDNIFVGKVDSDDSRRLTGDKERDINRFIWGNNHRILYLQDDEGDENFRLYSVGIHGEPARCLTDFPGVKTRLISRLRKRPDEVLIALNKRDARLFDVYRLNIRTGEIHLALENPGDARAWMADHDGVIRIVAGKSLMYRQAEDEPFEPILTTEEGDYFDPCFFTPDNKHVYAYSNVGRDRIAVVEYDPSGRKEVAVLFEHPVYDAFGDDERDHLAYSTKKSSLLYALYTAEKRKLHFFDREMEEWYGRVQERLGDCELVIESGNDDDTRFVLMASSDRLPGAYYLYDLPTDELRLLKHASPWLDEEKMASMRPVQYEARDGVVIHGYLTLPPDVPARNLPVVVHPHAGPQWRNSWGFDSKTQFLASRGYAVFQMNFRGSTGYGKEFLKAGFKQWGLRMQDDITDGVRWLVDEGIADPERIAILGWSYGGYAALAGMAFTPELYACGVDMWGISNYFTWHENLPSYWAPYLDQIHERWGDPVADSLQMARTSPIFHVHQIRAPLLIVQGENDPRVKMSQSEEMAAELRRQNKEVEYVLIPGEGHAFSNQDKTVRLMRKIDEFLERHLCQG